MSYKLINANDITFNSDGFITAENIEKMSCIYADLPNGMDGEHYVLEQQSILDKIRTEIEQITDTMGVSYNQYVSKVDVFDIIDKYRGSEEI